VPDFPDLGPFGALAVSRRNLQKLFCDGFHHLAQEIEFDSRGELEVSARGKAGYMISVVADSYQVHPQTLRLYERLGLLKPSRSDGNTRLYTDSDLKRLEIILNLTRDLGVNLAGVEVILNMRERMELMQEEMKELIRYVRDNIEEPGPSARRNALVRIPGNMLVRRGRDRK
jgi:MerR family transcriptional regulator/heat shock protein HspR